MFIKSYETDDKFLYLSDCEYFEFIILNDFYYNNTSFSLVQQFDNEIFNLTKQTNFQYVYLINI